MATATPRDGARILCLSEAELEELQAAAAKRGALEALERLGLHDGNAARDMAELRETLGAWRVVRRSVVSSALNLAGKGLAILILGAIAVALGADAAVRRIFTAG